ncbi:MAG TPA: hypothetical protein VJP58_03505 [Candidatus Nitrosocosmicus sp.]|nr:hypothetical protein [Candidatus Nitrosocosmicus sp.]
MKIKSNIQNSEYIIKQLFKECASSNDLQSLTQSDYISLAEGLMHFLLAITITPSQRKINICNTEVSILVPGASDLKRKSDKVIIIQFLKGDEIEYTKTINELLKIQPTFDNIWLISYRPIITTFGLKNFVIDDESIQNKEIIQPFSKVMIEINSFLDQINYNGFRII